MPNSLPKEKQKPRQSSMTASRHPSLGSSRLHTTLSHTQTQSQFRQQQEQAKDSEPYRPPFSPFFTLINDLGGEEGKGEGRETVHPRKIHYIFSDDDTSDLLTNSLIHSLHPLPPSSTSSPGASRELSSSQRESSSSSSATFRNPLKGKDKKEKSKMEKKEREERVIIVDINENGDGVKSVSSLSKDWQVLSASISSAPTFDSSSPSAQDPQNQNMQERGLMLRIEGVSVSALSTDLPREEEKRDSAVLGEEEMSQLLEGFDRKMGVLRRIISARASREELEGGGDGALDDGGILGAGGDDATAEVRLHGRRESDGGELGSG